MMLHPTRMTLCTLLLALLVACGDGGGGGGSHGTATATVPAATATATQPPPATPTTTSAVASVSGLVIVRSALAAGTGEDLGTPPPLWEGLPTDRALSHAEWRLEGAAGRSGVTAADGSLDLGALPEGEYRLSLRRSVNGNLVETEVGLRIGGSGSTRFLVELEQGQVRVSTDYNDGDAGIREIVGPDGSHVVVRNGEPVRVGDGSRELLDVDGDGSFLPTTCHTSISRCDDAGACGDGLVCQCAASCPFCEDCGFGVCAPRGSYSPYRCDARGGCSNPGDRCVCVPSCPDCDDCVASVCVPSCAPVEIAKLTIVGNSEIVVGRSSSLRAIAELDDGSSLDVTYLVQWASADESVATVDAWGSIQALRVGGAELRAALGEVASDAFALRVVERPALQRLEVQIAPCFYPLDRPNAAGGYEDAVPSDALPHPFCNDVVRVGRTVPLLAWAFYADGQLEDVTGQVSWSIDPASVGTIEQGQFTATGNGTASIRATLGSTSSEPVQLKVVDRPTVVELSIYPLQGPLPFDVVAAPGQGTADPSLPCVDCGYRMTVLLGDRLPFSAIARYDTGEWEDVTAQASWQSSSSSVVEISDGGVASAAAVGEATIDASFNGIRSNPVDLHVVAEATLVDIYIYQDGADRVVEKGGQTFFVANANYDIGFGRSVTDRAQWHSSDESVGGFDSAGVFTGRSAGQVEVWAELDGRESNRLPISVFERSDLTFCDADHVNRAVWSDAFNRVTLESDCATYTPPDVVELRFTVTERERPAGIFDPCLDLYVYQQGRKLRTIREQGCGEPFVAPGAPEFDDAVVRFQHKAFWDLRDDAGELLPPGTYSIVGRFYLYYDPVIRIAVTIGGDGGTIPCVENRCGNGCGYVHRCGDSELPASCPEVCRELCECPSGWGLTEAGDCEPCGLECCPVGSACAPELPPCAAPCCPPNARCLPETPPCPTDECCPAGQTCDPGLVSCDAKCCPIGALCGPLALPPCEPVCCPDGELCPPEVPSCTLNPGCCVPGDPCKDDQIPCGSVPMSAS